MNSVKRIGLIRNFVRGIYVRAYAFGKSLNEICPNSFDASPEV